MIGEALEELQAYLDAAGGKIDPALEVKAKKLLEFADRRLSAGHQTVAAIAGATGSGKSSLFNAISGTQLATAAVRRPTTSEPLALSFSATNGPLLNLLQISRRHEAEAPLHEMRDVVLVDLPDHDSTHLAHREEVDRLVELVDQFIFVVDPQKYADAALHDRYLKPLANHRDVITIVFNQADKITEGDPIMSFDGTVDEKYRLLLDDKLPYDPRLQRIVEHLRSILVPIGLGEVPIFVTSAITGEGVDLLRHHLGKVSTNKRATQHRLKADLRNLIEKLREQGGQGGELRQSEVDALNDEVAKAAGVNRLANEVRKAVRRQGAMIRSRRPKDVPALELPSHQVPSAGDDALANTAVRKFVAASTMNLPLRWRDEARRRIMDGPAKQLSPRIDAAMRAEDLSDLESPFGWGMVRMFKWLPIVLLVGFGIWLAVEIVWGTGEFAPKLLTIVAAAFAATILLGLLSEWILARGARRAEKKTRQRLGEVVHRELERGIVLNVARELEAHTRAEEALRRMTGILARGQ